MLGTTLAADLQQRADCRQRSNGDQQACAAALSLSVRAETGSGADARHREICVYACTAPYPEESVLPGASYPGQQGDTRR